MSQGDRDPIDPIKEPSITYKELPLKREIPNDARYNPSIGKKFDQEKPDWSLLDLNIIEEIVKVLNFGKQKYGKNNWRHLENAHDRYYAAMLRHLSARQAGEMIDPESGLPHLAHAGCCLFFMMWFDKNAKR